MSEIMTFPETVEEFMEQYKVVDTERVYTSGIELVPIFRMKQWFEHLPAVPHEMSAREFVREHHRMCQSKMKCVECRICHDDGEPRSCAVLMGLSPDDTVAVVEQWAREHSEERSEQ